MPITLKKKVLYIILYCSYWFKWKRKYFNPTLVALHHHTANGRDKAGVIDTYFIANTTTRTCSRWLSTGTIFNVFMVSFQIAILAPNMRCLGRLVTLLPCCFTSHFHPIRISCAYNMMTINLKFRYKFVLGIQSLGAHHLISRRAWKFFGRKKLHPPDELKTKTWPTQLNWISNSAPRTWTKLV